MSYKSNNKPRRVLVCLMASTALYSAPALAQADNTTAQANSASDEGSALGEIIVTAQKRSQSANSVGMAITAISGNELARQNITDVSGLAKIEPSLVVSQTFLGAPFYTLRGVGYNEQSISATPAVSVYTDEVPYSYPVLTQAANLDIERVEVLKGPQGTLFGQNATGGAINYIAAKPTDKFAAGVDASYSRFNLVDLSGFVSGPLSENVRVRLAGQSIQGGAFQRSLTRPNDTRGDKNIFKGRLLLEADVSEDFKVSLNLNGWRDRSETLGAQAIGVDPLTPAVETITPHPSVLPVFQRVRNALQFARQNLGPWDSRTADWDPGYALKRDSYFLQAALRMEYAVSDALKLTSITAWSHYKQDDNVDNDGSAKEFNNNNTKGRIQGLTQELRASGALVNDKLQWIVGGSFVYDKTNETAQAVFRDATSAPALQLAGNPPYPLPFNYIGFFSDQKSRTIGLFGNLEYEIIDDVKLHGGVRKTYSRIEYSGCTRDIDGNLAGGLGFPASFAGQCISLDSSFTPGLINDQLKEENVSWRGGIDWAPARNSLIYANVSKGYKAGSFATIPAVFQIQNVPVTQESVVAYEVGFKTNFGMPNINLTGAYFHYDYTDKQLRGKIVVFPFGVIDTLVNVPKSKEDGFELAGRWEPVRGLTFNGAMTWLNARVTQSFNAIDPFGAPVDLNGEKFPTVPEWSFTGGAEYRFSLNDKLSAYVGANGRYQTRSQGAFGSDRATRLNGSTDLSIKAYGILDLRAGIESENDGWNLQVFANNVTNTYYWTQANHVYDTSSRFAGAPVSYGVKFGFRY